MRLNGSQILMECLLEHNVDTVFGYPGGAVINIYDAIYEYQDRIRHILTSHDRGLLMPPMVMQDQQGKLEFALLHPAPERQTWLLGLLLPIWIQFQWWQSQEMFLCHYWEKIVFRK